MGLTVPAILVALGCLAALGLAAVGFAAVRLLGSVAGDAAKLATRYLDERADLRRAITAYEATYTEAREDIKRAIADTERRLGRLEAHGQASGRGRDVIATGLRPGA